MNYKHALLISLMPSFLFWTPVAAQAAPPPGDEQRYSVLAAYTQHLLDTHMYGNALNAAERMIEFDPSVGLGYEFRGAVCLDIGASAQASSDFDEAAKLSNDRATLLGSIISSFDLANYDSARRKIASLSVNERGSGNPDSQAGALFLAAIDIRTHKQSQARGVLTGLNIPASQIFLCCLDGLQGDKKSLPEFATSYRYYDPPQITQDVSQLRFKITGQSVTLAPAESSRDLRHLFRSRLKDLLALEGVKFGQSKTVGGNLELSPSTRFPKPPGCYVTYKVDENVVSIANTAPYAFRWDTAAFRNGPHTVRISITDTNGTLLSDQYSRFNVNNLGGVVDTEYNLGMSVGDYASSQNALCHHLFPAVARESFEYAWSHLCAVTGNPMEAESHALQASAMAIQDPAARRFVHSAIVREEGKQPLIDVWQGRTTRKEIALTFDDGPDPINLPKMFRVLTAEHLPATFFVVGFRAATGKALISQMVQRGDEVENHSYTHPNMALCTPLTIDMELAQTSILIHELTGRFPRFFRPPGGNMSDSVMQQARYFGMAGGFWTLDVFNYEERGDSNALAAYVLKHIHPGTVVLMHNGSVVSIRALPIIAAGLKAKGYRCVLLKDIGVSAVSRQERHRLKE